VTQSERHKRVLIALGLGVTAWAGFLVFENAYFAAPAFGISPPSWSLWVGSLSLLELNVIDTLAVAMVVLGVVLAWAWSPKKRRMGSRGVGALGAVALLIVVALLIYVAYADFHLTFSSVWCGILGFFGRSC
jgi:hypothetical protein